MAKQVLTGRQAKLYVSIDAVFKLVLCASECSFEFDHEEILETSRNSGKFVERDTRLCDWAISVTGLSKVDNADGQASWFWLMQQGIRGSKQLMKLVYTDAAGNVKNVTGEVLIKQGQFTSVVGAFSTASLKFPGTGAYDIDVVPGIISNDLFKLYLATAPGGWTVSHADLADVLEIMLVGRDGKTGFKEVIAAPVGKEFVYTNHPAVDGEIAFDNTIPFNPGEIAYVQYRK
jgi:hypothetical protein